MRIALHILGTEVLAITTDTTRDDDPGDVVTTAASVGFVADDLATEYRKGY